MRFKELHSKRKERSFIEVGVTSQKKFFYKETKALHLKGLKSPYNPDYWGEGGAPRGYKGNLGFPKFLTKACTWGSIRSEAKLRVCRSIKGCFADVCVAI